MERRLHALMHHELGEDYMKEFDDYKEVLDYDVQAALQQIGTGLRYINKGTDYEGSRVAHCTGERYYGAAGVL